MSTVWRALYEHSERWRHRPEREWIAKVAPLLVASVVSAPDAAWQTEAVVFTGTSVAVATVGHPESRKRFVVKVPWTVEGTEGLRRQANVLATLHTDQRLDTLRTVMPRHVGHGQVDGHYYCVEEALPGVPMSASALRRMRRAAPLRAAMSLIGDLHAQTRVQTVLDDAAIEAWVDAPLRRLEKYAGRRPFRGRLLDPLGRLREELVAALVGRTVRTSWIHGDFWPGNLLAVPPTGQVTGVVDWDCASAGQLPLHDLLHLHVFARRLIRGDELGDVVVHALRSGVGAALAVPAGEAAAWLDGIPQRSAVLLYWLRHILLFIDLEGHHDNPRWLRGNVERVLVNV